jgi:hypothetical protein
LSFLEMLSAPLPNMNKGIISLWFRDARKNPSPEAEPWPSGVWTPGTDSMIPPDVVKVAQQEEFSHNVFYWNSYGMNISGGGVTLPIFGPAAVMMPAPPPDITTEMHMMLTFGNPQQSHDYCQWTTKIADVIEGVVYVPMLVSGPQWSVPAQPPPYAPWIMAYGKFKPAMFVLDEPAPRSDFVPQSFIGMDGNGNLTICLQTDTKADYKGYAFQLDKVSEIWATATYYVAPPVGGGSPGHWVKVPGYWDGYEFGYTDVSDKVMGAHPETFIIGGPPGAFESGGIPPIRDGGWHHLLFSFDISGAVTLSIPSLLSGGVRPPPIVKTTCQAWLALDGKNYKGTALQHRIPIHDGFQLPLLPGMGTDTLGFGPVTTAIRANIGLGDDNDILPRNCWLIPFRGNPKDGLLRFASTAGLWGAASSELISQGDYNYFVWTGSIWPLYGLPGATDWRGELRPPRPSTPDPKSFDNPTYRGSDFNIPVAGWPIGVPVSGRHLKHNTGIEMAELQIWANQTIDTGDLAKLRLFIDAKGKPVPPKEAAKELGKPHVMLHGTGNWKAGRNTGSTGTDSSGNRAPRGQFVPVSKIEKFMPDPKLGQ